MEALTGLRGLAQFPCKLPPSFSNFAKSSSHETPMASSPDGTMTRLDKKYQTWRCPLKASPLMSAGRARIDTCVPWLVAG